MMTGFAPIGSADAVQANAVEARTDAATICIGRVVRMSFQNPPKTRIVATPPLGVLGRSGDRLALAP
jgi:hypothetical protein